MSSINPRTQGEGEVELGGVGVAWTSTLVEPERQGQTPLGGLGDYDIGLYEVEFAVTDNDRSLGTWRMRVTGHEKVRGLAPGEDPF